MKLVLALAYLGFASALCPNACSGHGSCGTFDRCTCYRNWQGKDCSDRTCPFSTSWNSIITESGTSQKVHSYAECSNKGECDRKAGECKCYEGFTGVACRRMTCDGDCSGHGTCETLEAITSGYTGWDAKKIQKCKCDPGWEGDMCESKMCKKGDDPMTLTTTDAGTGTTNFQVNEVQTITFSGNLANEEFTITYTDWRGQKWTTWALDGYAGTALSIEEALEALPNHAIPDVTVTGDFTTGAATVVVTFVSPQNAGDQAALVINSAGCETNGCQPKYKALTGTAPSIAETTKGTKEWSVCSDRGQCDAETGDCACFPGFTGQSCEIQTIVT